MPNLTTPIPSKLTGDTARDLSSIKKWGTALIDELTYIFDNLDAGNVLEAASVKAENIDTSNAKIANAQIGNITADKLRAGTIDTDFVIVKSGDGNMTISGNSIKIDDGTFNRFNAEYDSVRDIFRFELCNSQGEPTVSINSNGDAVFRGKIDSSEIYSSTIVGTDSYSYEIVDGGVFAMMDPQGVKIMQDNEEGRHQRLGLSVGNDGTAYMVMGAGNGSEETVINGVRYSNGSFLIKREKGSAALNMVGSKAIAAFMDNGELWLSGEKVLINGRDVLAELDALK